MAGGVSRGFGLRLEFHEKCGTDAASRSLDRMVRSLVRFLYDSAIKLSDFPVYLPVCAVSYSGVGLELHG